MQAILTAVIPVVIIGILCAAMLVVASKLMAVKEDERFPKVRECLPGANCGACGYAGCDGYAKALVDDSSVPANLCVPGGEGVARELMRNLDERDLRGLSPEADIIFESSDGRTETTDFYRRMLEL